MIAEIGNLFDYMLSDVKCLPCTARYDLQLIGFGPTRIRGKLGNGSLLGITEIVGKPCAQSKGKTKRANFGRLL